jgi:hypothetical protein
MFAVDPVNALVGDRRPASTDWYGVSRCESA